MKIIADNFYFYLGASILLFLFVSGFRLGSEKVQHDASIGPTASIWIEVSVPAGMLPGTQCWALRGYTGHVCTVPDNKEPL